jgi:predicted RNA-binding Zn-ribbon protein involved in translation (DUF1610 family)
MKWKYECPHCRAVLNPNVKIILRIRRGKHKGLILFSPRPGNYQSICDPDFGVKLKEDELVEFACPVCGEILTSTASKKLAELLLLRPADKVHRIQFSRVYGEHATFILDGDSVVPYGEDAALYDEVNFFGV